MPFTKRRKTRATRPRRHYGRRFYGAIRHRVKDKTIPLSYLGAMAVPIAGIINGDPLVGTGGVMNHMSSPQDAVNELANCLVAETTGYQPWSGNWQWSIMARNIGLIAGAVIAHKLAAPVNRKMKNIPFVGKYLSI